MLTRRIRVDGHTYGAVYEHEPVLLVPPTVDVSNVTSESFWLATDEQRAEIERRGIDSDLRSAIEYNAQPFHIGHIEHVLAVIEGGRDERDWQWLIKLDVCVTGPYVTGPYAYVTGGCDYSGWD